MIVRVGQLQLAPPVHVGQVAERAAHRDAGALVRLGGRVREHRHLDAEQRRAHRRAEQRLVALVVGVRDQRHARPGSARAGWSRCRPGRRRRGTRPGGRRRGTRGPRARPARPRSGRSRPTASAPPAGRPRRGRGCAGTPAATTAWDVVADGRVGLRPVDATARACATAPRTPARRSASARSHSSMKFCRLIGTWRFGSGFSGGVKSGSYGSDGSHRTP